MWHPDWLPLTNALISCSNLDFYEFMLLRVFSPIYLHFIEPVDVSVDAQLYWVMKDGGGGRVLPYCSPSSAQCGLWSG